MQASRVEESSRLLVGLVVDLSGEGVALDRLDAVDRARLALVVLAGRDHLAVGRDQVEAELPVEPFLSTNLAAMRPPLGRSLLARTVSNRPSQRPANRGLTPCMPYGPAARSQPITADELRVWLPAGDRD